MGGSGEGVVSRAKLPMVAYCLAIRPTRTFTWYNSMESVSRRASMRCSCAMTSPSVTLTLAKEEVDVDGVERDGTKREGGAAESDYLNRNFTSLRFTVAASMAHMKVKWSDKGKGIEKWCKILVIAEGKMSLSRDTESRWTSIIDRMKWEGKSIVKCLRRDYKNRVQGSVMEL